MLSKWLDEQVFPNGISGYRATHTLTHPWLIFEDTLFRLIWLWQRIYIGIDDRAIWDVANFVSQVIAVSMRKKLKYDYGVPMFYIHEYQIDWESLEVGKQKLIEDSWKQTIREIAEGFELYGVIQPDSTVPENLENMAKFYKAFDLFRKYFFCLLW